MALPQEMTNFLEKNGSTLQVNLVLTANIVKNHGRLITSYCNLK